MNKVQSTSTLMDVNKQKKNNNNKINMVNTRSITIKSNQRFKWIQSSIVCNSNHLNGVFSGLTGQIGKCMTFNLIISRSIFIWIIENSEKRSLNN